jgi:peroxiredoxin
VHRIAQLRDRFEDLRAHGLDVLVVLCQKPSNVAEWLAKHPLPFPILIDDDRSRAKRWGVYVPLSYDSIHIARPATFVVDAAGIVRYARIARHQMDPAPFSEILAAAADADADRCADTRRQEEPQ